MLQLASNHIKRGFSGAHTEAYSSRVPLKQHLDYTPYN